MEWKYFFLIFKKIILSNFFFLIFFRRENFSPSKCLNCPHFSDGEKREEIKNIFLNFTHKKLKKKNFFGELYFFYLQRGSREISMKMQFSRVNIEKYTCYSIVYEKEELWFLKEAIQDIKEQKFNSFLIMKEKG